MTSHIVVPAIDPELPATLSPKVLSVLREQLGFDGVVVTDALDMAGASGDRGIPEAAVLALVAGARPALPRRRQGRRPRPRGAGGDRGRGRGPAGCRSSGWSRPRTTSPGWSRTPGPRRQTGASSSPVAQLAGARAAVTVEGDLPRLGRAWVVAVDTAANIAVGDGPLGPAGRPRRRPGPGALAGVPADRPLVVQVRDAHRHPDGRRAAGRGRRRGPPAVVVEWGWPGDVRRPPAEDLHPRRLPTGARRRDRAADGDGVGPVTARP